MCTVELNAIEACSLTTNGGSNTVLDKPFYFFNGHGFRSRRLIVRGAHWHIVAVATHGTHAAVVELDHRMAAVRLYPFREPRETF